MNDAYAAELLLLAEFQKLSQSGFGFDEGHTMEVEFGFQVHLAVSELGEQFVLNAGAAVFQVFLIAHGVGREHIGESLAGDFMLDAAFAAGFDFGFGAFYQLAFVANRRGVAHFLSKQREVIVLLIFLPVSHERDKT